ncbi:MAG: glycoside hydrolase family 88 protein [Halobacteriaceae archaeon]
MHHEATLSRREVSAAMDAMVDRIDATLAETGERFPFWADPETGAWETLADGNWCGGHWVGLLWLASERAGSAADRERFAAAAYDHVETLRESGVVESMFGGMSFLYAGFRGYDVTGDRSLFGDGLAAADTMVELYDETARQIPLGEYEVAGPDEFDMHGSDEAGETVSTHTSAVDCIYTTLPVLWRAFEETGDTRFRDVALSHADRHLDLYIRDDGRIYNLAEFDAETGGVVDRYNHLAHSNETCWARGVGWNVAGLARAYAETGAERFLSTLELCVDYYVERSPEDLVPYWDFEAPGIPDEPRDTSSAGLVAYGLTLLDGDGERERALRQTGEAVLASLVEDYLVTDAEDDRRGMVLHGCYDKPGEYATDNELVWTDYYVAYALHDLLARTD